MKECFKCHNRLPLSGFHKHPQMADGHLGKCKACTRADVKNNRKNRSEHYKAFDVGRALLPHRVAARLAYKKTAAGKKCDRKRLKKYRRDNPEKTAANGMVARAIKSGRIKKQPCERCGVTEPVHAHHEDYKKPLQVVWLCAKHHRTRHRELLQFTPRSCDTS